jgi:TonB family protein
LNGCAAAATQTEPRAAESCRAAGAATLVSASIPNDQQSIRLQQAAKPVQTPAPEYPESERPSGTEARVIVHFAIDERGRVSVISAEGPPAFRQKALEAVATWRFAPATVDGVPHRSEQKARFRFRVAI